MSSELPFEAAEVSVSLLEWYGAEGRDLPWRHTRDPYAIWLSEIMLQQTGVETVIPYYRKFLDCYPDVVELAAAPVEEVIELWAGLGYYRRARNLHAAANMVAHDLSGVFPDTLEGLQALPGVGRSTAGAILSIAYDRPAPILDGNVRRVLCRLFALHGDPRSPAAEKQLWRWAEALTSVERPHDYAQAIMDLGATLCTPRKPDCPRCPWRDFCQAHLSGKAEALPQARSRQPVPLKRQVALVLENKDAVLVSRRGLDGMLAGLWEFPARELPEGETDLEVAEQLAAERGGRSPALLGKVKHAYSHFHLEVHLFSAAATGVDRMAESGASRWIPRRQIESLALHGAHKKALQLYLNQKES